MGVWDYVYGAGESVRRNSPDLTSVKSLLSSSYGYIKATVCSVKENAGNSLSLYWPTEEAQSKIISFAKSVAKYSAEETLKFVPGGSSAYNILKKSHRDANKSEKINDGDHRTVAERLEALEREIGEYKRSSVGQSQTETNVEKAVRLESDTNPESVIREFMEKEFMGRQFLNALIVPGTSRTV